MMSFDLQSDPGAFSAFYQEARLKTILSRCQRSLVGTGVVLALGALALFTATR